MYNDSSLCSTVVQVRGADKTRKAITQGHIYLFMASATYLLTVSGSGLLLFFHVGQPAGTAQYLMYQMH